MDTHGHQWCAETAGKPMFEAALGAVRKQGWRLQGLYLGNWLTDVSQAVDPVAYRKVARGIVSTFDMIKTWLKELDPPFGTNWIRDGALNRVDSLRSKAETSVKVLEGGRSSKVGQGFKTAFRLKGYFKFVHPETYQGRAQMDYPSYRHVFDALFTQYYPHEHMDRFPDDPNLARKEGTRTPDGVGTGSRNLSPHLYEYLVDDVQIVAARLAQIDYDWAESTFRPGSNRWAGDTDPSWNLWLAKLGHQLHAVEDFFAHSNFVELAIEEMSDRDRLRPDRKSGIAWEVYEKRLKRYTGTARDKDARWISLDAEPFVVTGYFDFIDTFFSLRHVVEELLAEGGPPPVGHSAEKAMAILRKTIEAVHQEAGGRTLSKDEARRIAERALTGGDPSVKAAADELIASVIPDAKEDVRNDFLDAVAWFSLRTGPGTMTLFEALVFLHQLANYIEYPAKFLSWLVGEWIPDWLNRKLYEFARDRLDPLIGRYRVGCHSLMAKDYAWGNTQLDKIYEHAKNCAAAVHWYVVSTMTRWAWVAKPFICRFDQNDGRGGGVCTIDQRDWIDWLELIEYFLRNPQGVSVPAAAPDVNSLWWARVIRGGVEKFPGFGFVVAPPAEAPHRPVSIAKGEVLSLAQRGQVALRAAEAAYR